MTGANAAAVADEEIGWEVIHRPSQLANRRPLSSGEHPSIAMYEIYTSQYSTAVWYV